MCIHLLGSGGLVNQCLLPFVCLFVLFCLRQGLCVALAVLELNCVDQAGLELRNPTASASRVLGLKACATTV